MESQSAAAHAPTYRRTLDLATAALIVSLIAVSAWITLPIGAVPVTLQVFFVVLAALLLPPGWAAASMITYVALGTAGLPVFSGAQGGLGVLAGPSGGYLTGFVVGATTGSIVRGVLARRVRPAVADAVAATVVVGIVYAVGAVQLAFVANLTPMQAFVAGVAPFLVGDAIKAAVAVGIAATVRRARR